MQTFIERKLALEFWKSMSTLNELIGYVVLTDCREIWPEDSKDNDKQTGVREFRFSKYFSRGDCLRNSLQIFFSTQTLEVDN